MSHIPVKNSDLKVKALSLLIFSSCEVSNTTFKTLLISNMNELHCEDALLVPHPAYFDGKGL